MKANILMFALASLFVATASHATAQPSGYFQVPKPIENLQRGQFDFGQTVTADGRLIVFNSNGTLYEATRSSREQAFGNAKPLGAAINTTAFDETGPTLTADGLALVFQRDPPGPTDNTAAEMNLFEARRTSRDEPFGEAAPLPDAINEFSAFLPSLTADGRMLLFSSTRPGGKGREDIWVATRASLDDTFGAPVNFDAFFPGSQVNSVHEEIGPSLSSDGLVIFFSDNYLSRPGGRGGPDIWVSTRANQSEPFGPSVNLNDAGFGSMVNQSSWDGFVFISRDWPDPGARLYFSHWQGNGELNLEFWEAEWAPFRMTRVTPPESWGGLVSLTAKAGLLVDVQFRENLTSGGWTSVRGPVVAQADSLEVPDVRAKYRQTPRAFYRAVIPDETFAREIAGSYLGTVPELNLKVLVKIGADGTTVRVSDADKGFNGQAPFASRSSAQGAWTQTAPRMIRLVETGFEFDPNGLPVSQWQSGKAVVDVEFHDSQTASGSVQAWTHAKGQDPLLYEPAERIKLGSVQLRRIR